MPVPNAPPEAGPEAAPEEPKAATLLQVAGAVFWSFFGVRKGKSMQRDAVTIKPLQVIVVGVALAAILVLALIVLVKVILLKTTS